MSFLNVDNINPDYLNTSITDYGLKSARNNSIKDKFALFYARKENKRNKTMNSSKRMSELSADSSNISDDKGYEGLKTSRDRVRYVKKESDKLVNYGLFSSKNGRKSLIKEKSNLFSQFEDNLKNHFNQPQKTTRVIINHTRYSKNINRYREKEAKENAFSEYFTIKDITPFDDKIRDSPRKSKFSHKAQTDSIPELVLSDIKNSIQSYEEILKNNSGEISDLFCTVKEEKSHLSRLKYNQKEMTDQLKEIKIARNKLITEQQVLSNELDFLKSSGQFINTKISTDKTDKDPCGKQINSKEKGITTGNKSQPDQTVTTELDSAIDELQTKISYLKFENSKFFENIDFLNDEYAENEDKNKTLKNHIKYLDKIIEGLMKDRNTLKASYNKLYPNSNGVEGKLKMIK